MDTQILIAVGIIAVALIIILVRRVNWRYGKIRPNRYVAEAYEGFRVDPDLIYYISGSDVYPNAIIGIDKAWILESDLWKRKELSSLDMKELVQNMQSKVSEMNMALHGFDILDNHGRKIGNWYSILGLNMTVEITGDNRAVVYTPPLDTYHDS